MTAQLYSAIFGGYDSLRPQVVPVQVVTGDDPDPRLAAKWHKLNPPPGVSVWLDGSMDVLSPDFPDEMERELGADDLLLFRHPWRDCIYAEAEASLRGAKYDGMPILEQACAYRRAGHPEHWGLAHCGSLVRRDTPAIRDLNSAWWSEITRWTVQDQISLPYLLRRSPVRWHWAPEPLDHYLRFVGHLGPDVWR